MKISTDCAIFLLSNVLTKALEQQTIYCIYECRFAKNEN